VLVSEIMLRQTPVARCCPLRGVAGPLADARSLAGAPAAVRGGAPGYAAGAQAARRCPDYHRKHAGQVPAAVADLAALPGVGSYTAAAVASFAFAQRHAVLDTNVRRVLARLVRGQEFPARSTSAAEVRLAESLLPAGRGDAARWSVAVMELGALVCTAARPRCAGCPVATQCCWRLAGSPAGVRRPVAPRYEGSDRQCRGSLLVVLRDAGGPVGAAQLEAAWPDRQQRDRALDGLVADGLAEPLADGRFALPG
jgi:A/G-specific adenine glycosylase